MPLILHNLTAWLLGGLGVLAACAGPSPGPTPASGDGPGPMQADAPGEEAPSPAPQPDADTVRLLDQIEAVSSEIDTLRCRVRYTRLQTLTGDQQVRFGDFYYAASDAESPTLFAILFDRLVIDERARPMQTWYIFDGNWLLERDHGDKTATRRELVPEGAERSDTLVLGDGQVPIPLRLKADAVLDTYHVVRLPDEPFGEQTLHRLQLTPKQAHADAAPLGLWFDSETLRLHKVVTTEDADEIELVFSLVKPNAEIEPGVFDTALPDPDEGWQVQEVPIKP